MPRYDALEAKAIAGDTHHNNFYILLSLECGKKTIKAPVIKNFGAKGDRSTSCVIVVPAGLPARRLIFDREPEVLRNVERDNC